MKKKAQPDDVSYDVMKVMVVGSAGVGKSCIINRFLSKPLDVEYKPTKQDVYTRTVELERESCQVEIYDTAGFFSMSSYRDALYKCADGFLLVFSIIDEGSFADLDFLKERILINKPDASLIVVGNKKDLLDIREVKAQEGTDLAAKWGTQYYESSALLNDNVIPIFKTLVQDIIKQRKLKHRQATPKDKCVIM